MHIYVEVILGWYTLTIHHSHILSTDGDEILDTDIFVVSQEQEKRLLASLRVDTSLSVR